LGSLSGTAPNLTYTPDGGYFDGDAFRYQVSDGTTTSGVATVWIASRSGFVCQIRKNGDGDYTNLTTWANAMKSDLTSSSSKVFTVSSLGTYVSSDDGTNANVVFTGGGTGVLRHINKDNLAYITACSGTIQAGTVTCTSGNTFTIAGIGWPVTILVAEGYNDWPNGLVDALDLTVTGWKFNASHYAVVRAAADHGHNGTALSGGVFAGFAIQPSGTYKTAVKGGIYCRAENLILSLTTQNTGVNMALGGRAYGCIAHGKSMTTTTGFNCSGGSNIVQNCLAYSVNNGFSIGVAWNSAPKTLFNCTAVNCNSGFLVSANQSQSAAKYIQLQNCLAQNAQFTYSTVPRKLLYNASSDGSATSQGGVGNRANQVFTFVDASSTNYHLANTDTGALDKGLRPIWCPLPVDVDGEIRTDPWDIGFDETEMPDDDNDDMPDSWEDQNFGGTNTVNGGALDDWDYDGMFNLAEYIAGTSPTNAGDSLKIADAMMPDEASATGMVIRWTSVAGKTYGIQTATNLILGFDGWAKSGIPATPTLNTYTVIVDQIRSRYYRVTVEQ
jgi:hypothetical protein